MESNEFEMLRAEAAEHARRAKKATYLEAKKELADNLYPFLEDLIEKIDQRFSETEDMVAELVETTESVIQPELHDQIIGALVIGMQLCDLVIKIVETTPPNEETLKRLQENVKAYRAAYAMTVEAVDEVTLDPDDEEDDDDSDEDADDDDEEPEAAKKEEA